MATITASAAGGNWSATTAWSGGVVPTATDDVLLSGSSGNITVTNGAVCQSLNCTGYTGTLSHPASTSLTIGSSSAGAGNVALLLVSGMTYSVGSTTTTTVVFVSTAVATQTITAGGKTLPTMTFNGAGASWQFQDAIAMSSSLITLTAGSLDTNSKTITAGGISSSNTNVRSLTLGASTITLSINGGGGTQFATSTNMTLNAGTSSITISTSNSGTNFGSNFTYNNVVVNYANGSGAIVGPGCVFNNLTLQGGNQARLIMGSDLTVAGQFSLISASGNSTNVPVCYSSVSGTQRTITVSAAPIVSNVVIQDLIIDGPSVPYATTNTGDGGNNSGLTFSTPRTLYWVATTGGSYASTSTWSLSSGGANGQAPPLPQDTIVFDANSITSSGRTLNFAWQGMPTLNFTNITNSPTLNFVNTNGFNFLFGSLTIPSSATVTGTTSFVTLSKTTQSLTTNGVTMTMPLSINSTNTVQLGSNWTSTNTITHNNGTFTANSYNVTCTSMTSSATTTRSLTMGSGIWTVTGTGTVWQFSTMTGLTLDQGTSTLVIADTSATSKTISHGSAMTLNNVTVAGGTGAVIFGANSLTVNNLTVSAAPATLTFTAGSGSATLLQGTLTATGSSGNLITINSGTSGSQAYLTKTSGVVSCDYLSLKDSRASGGAAFYAGANSVNVSNNTGWAFLPPSTGVYNLMPVMI